MNKGRVPGFPEYCRRWQKFPIREVRLNEGTPDSNGYASHSAIRDSLFKTEWFDWPVSAEIKYDRLMLFQQAGILTFNIDTMVTYDTIGDTVLVFDTIPGTFTIDSSRRTDSCFIGSGIQMKYTVELVHSNSHVDTVEQLIYNPYLNKYIWPMTTKIAHVGFADDTVMLRVRGDFTGIPDADSNVAFLREIMLDTYPSWLDTTVAMTTGGGSLSPPDTCFYAAGPFSNPSHPAANDVSILVHYCISGPTITAQVYDGLGNPVGSPSTFVADGQTWDRLPITAPGTAGSYHILVTAGTYSTTLGYAVY